MEGAGVGLMDLCDETLVHIFTFLDSTDLYHLSFVSVRLEAIVRDDYLWVWCDGRMMPNTKEKIKFCEDNLNRKSRVVMLAGECHSEVSLSASFFPKAVALQNLTVLALENQFLDGRKVQLRNFPTQLEELSLTRSYVAGYREFFKNCSNTLKTLRVLKLDRCQWFESHSLIPISKLPSLEILSFYLCKQLSDRDMCYISLAGRLGFKILKVLDVRFTGLGDEVLKSFYKHLHLSELYFQGYAKTYQLECAQRKLELLHGGPTKFHNYRDPFLEVDDTSAYSMIDMFGQSFTLATMNIQKVTDTGVRGYSSLERDLTAEYVPPKSVLYKRPYGKCKCGFVKTEHVEERIAFGSPYEPERCRLEKQIESLIGRTVTPAVYYLEPNRTTDEETPRDIAWLGAREPMNDMEILIYEHLSAQAIHEQDALSTNIIEVDFSSNQIRARDSMEAIRIPRELPRQAHFFHRDAQNILRENSVRISMIGRENGAMVIEELRPNGSPPLPSEANGSSELNAPSTSAEAGPSNRPEEMEARPGPSRKRKIDGEVAGPSKRRCCENKTCVNNKEDGTGGDNRPCDKCATAPPHQRRCNRCDQMFELYLHNNNCENLRLICPDCIKRCEPRRTHPYIVTWGEQRCVACGQYVSQMFFSSNAVVPAASAEWKCPDCTQRNAPANEDNVVLPPVQRNERQLNVHVLRIEGRDNHVPALDRIIVSQLAGQRLIGNLANSITPLRVISLRGYDRITDLSLRYLKHLHLDLIDVTYTKVTKRGVETFLRDNPNCRIVHESACQCGPELHF